MLVTAIMVSGYFTYSIARNALRREITTFGEQTVRSFATANSLDFLGGELGVSNLRLKLNTIVTSDAQNRIMDAFVLDVAGDLLAKARDGQAWPPALSLLHDLHRNQARVVESTPESIAVAAPALYADTRLGYVVFRFSNEPIRRAGLQILRQAGAVIAIFLVVNVLFLILMLQRVLHPVAQLGSASEAFAKGDFRRRIDLRNSKDEIGRAAQSFNEMADALEVHMRFSNAALVDGIRSGGTDRAQEHQLSVVFGDAVGYTNWASRHSPEEIFQTLSRYYTCIGRITVSSFGGIIDKFIGDGIMMHFGMLSESRTIGSVERGHVLSALRATIYSQFALRILDYAIQEFEQGHPLAYRFGLASGKCMMGAVGARQVMLDYSIIGNVVNLASRLEGKAPPGGLLVDSFTIKDIGEGFVEIADGGLQSVKGIDKPVRVYFVRRFCDEHEMRTMRRFLLDDFLGDPLIRTTLLGESADPGRLEKLQKFTRSSLDHDQTLPIGASRTPEPTSIPQRGIRRIGPGTG